jgi:peptide chain release factor 1
MADEAKKYLEKELLAAEQKINETRLLLSDPGMAEMAKTELEELEKQKNQIMQAMEDRPPSHEATEGQDDQYNKIILEVRPGVGGDEAKIWADDLLRMYTRYAGIKEWKTEIIDEGVMEISGKGPFKAMRWETGVHRVQRVPTTEAQGRIHTSTASIVVLPEVPENLIEVKEDDLLWEFTTGGGHGGQNVNKVATAVRLTHKPSGIVVQSRQERVQEQNRKIALALLRSQLWEIEEEKKLAHLRDQRAKIGRSMRSEKIRTYNYPQNRVTDHRIGKSWHKLDKIMQGDLDDVTAACLAYFGENNPESDNQTTQNKE